MRLKRSDATLDWRPRAWIRSWRFIRQLRDTGFSASAICCRFVGNLTTPTRLKADLEAWQSTKCQALVRSILRGRTMGAFSEIWKHVKDTVQSFINDEALSRGAAIAFYTVTSIAPVLLIEIPMPGL